MCVVKIASENKRKRKAYSDMSRDCHVLWWEQTSSVSDFKTRQYTDLKTTIRLHF